MSDLPRDPEETEESVGPDAPLRPGDQLDRFSIVREIGRGGMGIVYLARDEQLGRNVALKRLSPMLSSDPGFRERFVRECQVAAAIEHPNVIPIYAARASGDDLYLAMRFVEGSDLRKLLRDGPLNAEEAVRVVSELAGALDAAHRHGLVHRDVKPANVLVRGGDGHVYLTDFGVSKVADGTQMTEPGRWLGTVDYISPEQFRGEEVDARSDVYSLGCVLYECLTGHVPFEGSTARKIAAHLHDAAPLPSVVTGQSNLDGVVATAMAKDPEQRFQSAGELAAACRAALGAPGAGKRLSRTMPRPSGRTVREGLLGVGAALAVIAALAAAYLVLLADSQRRPTSAGTDSGARTYEAFVSPTGGFQIDRPVGWEESTQEVVLTYANGDHQTRTRTIFEGEGQRILVGQLFTQVDAADIAADGQAWFDGDPLEGTRITKSEATPGNVLRPDFDEVISFAAEGGSFCETGYCGGLLVNLTGATFLILGTGENGFDVERTIGRMAQGLGYVEQS